MFLLTTLARYRYLWSNGPKECLEFADYSFEAHFKRPIPSYPPRAVLHDYIKGRVERTAEGGGDDVRSSVRFRTAVKDVQFSAATDTFTVTVKDLLADRVYAEEFDFVICASGHFSVPAVPEFPGFSTFKGRILHAHDFRDALEFVGQDILLVGSSYSAEDIGSQCYKYGAKSLTFSYRTRKFPFDFPDRCEMKPLLTHVEGKTAFFKDGTSREVDAIVLCTGYLHHFPFLPDELRLKTNNRLYPPSLYKGIFWEANPKLAYVGMQDQYYTFNMFDAQAWYVRDVILGRITLPSPSLMSADIAKWQAGEAAVANNDMGIDFQTDYVQDLLSATDYPPLNTPHIAALFKQWETHKIEGIMTYRDRSYVSPVTGTLAPAHHTKWLEAMDDTLEAFLGTGEGKK